MKSEVGIKSEIAKNARIFVPYDPSCWFFGARSGGDCACCGNYSGGCWKYDLACYIHDRTFETCKLSWYCFSGCKPTPC